MPVCLCTRKFMAFFQISAITVVKSSLPFFTTKRGTCVRITSMMHKPSVLFRFIKSRLTFFKKSIYCCHYVISTTSQLSPEHASVCDPTESPATATRRHGSLRFRGGPEPGQGDRPGQGEHGPQHTIP